VQGDYLYNKTLNKNDFTDRFYDNSDTIRNQVKRNRITTVSTGKAGVDWQADNNNSITVFGLFSSEYVRDHGDIPYFDYNLTKRSRLWQFYEDEVNSAATASASYQHKFKQPGHLLNVSLNYTFHREDEKYFLTDDRPTYTGRDTFMLIADEHVTDINLDYVRPLKQGRIEGGIKFRKRNIPTNMRFFPGINSPLDVNAGGEATYNETIPAVYSNYIYESKIFELEAGVRVEYVDLGYYVNPGHNTYQSDGYTYIQPFPRIRFGYKLNDNNKLSFFYNRRVDRPDEVDIRIFPKYDDPEILKVGNPTLHPQFTSTIEMGYRREMKHGYFYSAIYYRTTNGTITRIGTIVPNSTIIYSIFQNAGRSYNTGVELLLQQNVSKVFSFNTNVNVYQNRIDAFTVVNKYPVSTTFSAERDNFTSGNIKFNGLFNLPKQTDIQITAIYLAPDIIPQGKIDSRFSVDAGLKKQVQKGKGELFLNASDIFNTLRTRKEIKGNGFRFLSTDYYETQVFRIGYNYKF
jgi:outer membrane receptor protein involved in Fe transport